MRRWSPTQFTQNKNKIRKIDSTIWKKYYSTSCNALQFGDSSIEGHLAALKSPPDAGTGPRFLTPHSEPAASPLPSRMPSTLSLRLLPWPRLRAQVIQPKSSTSRSFLGSRSRGILNSKRLPRFGLVLAEAYGRKLRWVRPQSCYIALWIEKNTKLNLKKVSTFVV